MSCWLQSAAAAEERVLERERQTRRLTVRQPCGVTFAVRRSFPERNWPNRGSAGAGSLRRGVRTSRRILQQRRERMGPTLRRLLNG